LYFTEHDFTAYISVLDTSNFLRIVNICGQTVDCYTSVVLCPAQTVVCLCIRPCVCVCVLSACVPCVCLHWTT